MNRLLKIFSFILLTVFVTILLDCTKERQKYSIINTDWEVWSIISPDRLFFLKSPTPYPVHFQKDNIFTIRLDVNSCGSTYRVHDENLIDIEPICCTLICCDKPFADTLCNILKDVNSFKITGKYLELLAPNRIINLTKFHSGN
jgi:hypothetical protein